MPHSNNKRTEQIVGKRKIPPGAIPFDQPCELGYHCPVCKYPMFHGDYPDERLYWSEYNGFIWCSVCNKDYPACICYNEQSGIPQFMRDQYPDCETPADFATEIYLASIEKVKIAENGDV